MRCLRAAALAAALPALLAQALPAQDASTEQDDVFSASPMGALPAANSAPSSETAAPAPETAPPSETAPKPRRKAARKPRVKKASAKKGKAAKPKKNSKASPAKKTQGEPVQEAAVPGAPDKVPAPPAMVVYEEVVDLPKPKKTKAGKKKKARKPLPPPDELPDEDAGSGDDTGVGGGGDYSGYEDNGADFEASQSHSSNTDENGQYKEENASGSGSESSDVQD